MPSDSERIAVLEEQVRSLSEAFDKHASETRAEYKSLEAKVDELLTIKNQGLGAVWLASALIGSGIITGVLTFVQWLKG